MDKKNLTLEEVEAVIQEYTALRKELAKETGQTIIQELFTPLFTFNGIKAASWYQYTPYFNDGDACVFNVYADVRLYSDNEALADGEDDDEYGQPEYGYGFDEYGIPDSIPDVYVRPEPDPYYTRVDSWSGRNRIAEWESYQEREEKRINTWRSGGWTNESLRDLKSHVRKINNWLGDHEDFLEDVFGDHVKIVVTPSGITVHDYDHD